MDNNHQDEDGVTLAQVWEARTTHHEDATFPVVPPDMWYSHKDGYKQIIRECWDHYRELLPYPSGKRNKENLVGSWKKSCKHYIRGSFYKDIEERFYVVPMEQPMEEPTIRQPTKKGDTRRRKGRKPCSKYRIVVSVRDKEQKHWRESHIEFSHTPLRQVSKGVTRGFGQVLYENAIASKITNNDCRSGVNFGAMSASGTRCTEDGKLVAYANTTDLFHELEKLGENYFKKYGFGKAVMNLKKVLVMNGLDRDVLKVSGLFKPWFTLSITSMNYGNECHIDPNDAAPCITIWHECAPAKDPKKNIKNWYFIFPDMEILVDGQWHKGVAIPLQHGTVVTWDGNLIRHCTAVPTLETHPWPKITWPKINTIHNVLLKKKKNNKTPGSDKSVGWGTYFGIQNTVVKAGLILK